MKEEIVMSIHFEVEPSVIYSAWLDSELHGKMTGGSAICSNRIGDSFSSWDGYISGKNVNLVENELIVQSWRSTDFLKDDEDSILTLKFNKIPEGTELILIHSEIPTGQTQYENGWIEHYFNPMKDFFHK